MVSEKNDDVLTANRKVRNIVAAAIFLRRIVKFVIACIILDISGKLNPKKFGVVKQRIEPMSRNSRRPGPSKKEVVNWGFSNNNES